MHQSRCLVATIAVVDEYQFLGALVEGIELKVGRGMIHPRHALGCGSPCSSRDNDLQSAEVATCVALLTAEIEPEDAQREDAIDGGGRLRLADADDCVGSGSFEKAASHIRRPEAVFEIHCGTEAVDLGSEEGTGEDTFE